MEGKAADAEAAYRRVLEIDTEAPVAANNLAWIYAERQDDLDKALALARSAIARLPNNPQVLDTLGWIYYRRGEAEQAIPQFIASIEKNPKNPVYHYHLGLAYVAAASPAKARVAFSRALAIGDDFPGADDARRALEGLGQ
jgi:tetratricopeptide (TPR) repeat protein